MIREDYKYRKPNLDYFGHILKVEERNDVVSNKALDDLAFTHGEIYNRSKIGETWDDFTVEEKFMAICATQTRDEAACLCGLLSSDEKKEIMKILTENKLEMLKSVLQESLT